MFLHRLILSAADSRLCSQAISETAEVEHQETAVAAVHLTLLRVTAAETVLFIITMTADAELLRIMGSTLITMTADASLLIHVTTAADAMTGRNLAAADKQTMTALFSGAVFFIKCMAIIKIQSTLTLQIIHHVIEFS